MELKTKEPPHGTMSSCGDTFEHLMAMNALMDGDPDILKCDDNRFYFIDTDIDGVKYILTSDHPNETEKAMLIAFHGDNFKRDYSDTGNTWADFNAAENVIAYRGGRGYTYNIWNYTPDMMEEIKQIQSEKDAINARLRQSVINYVESHGTISADENNLGETEQIDVYDKDGESHEADIKAVCISDGALWVSVADYHHEEQDQNVEVSEGMLWAVIQFLDYHKTEQEG